MLAIYMRKFSILKMRKFNKRGITIKKRDRYSCGTRVSWSLFYFFSALG